MSSQGPLQERVSQSLTAAQQTAAEGYKATKDLDKIAQGLESAQEKASEGYDAATTTEDHGLQEKIEQGLATAQERAAEGYDAAKEKVQQVAESPSDETQFMDKVQGGLSAAQEKMVHGYEAFKHKLVGVQAEKPNVPDAKEKVKEGIEAAKQTGPVEATKAFTGEKEEGKSGKVLSAVVTFAMEGCVDILSWNQLWRFVISALLFTLASGLVLTAYMVDTSAAEVVTFGYSYMPISAVLSYYAFNRRYGRLEWLSVGIITLGVFAFVLLREECREGKVLQFQMKGFLLVLASVFFSATGSILAEQVFKDRTLGPVQNDRFYVMKFHLDLTATAVAAVLWVLPLNHTALITDFMLRWEQSKSWFGIWNLHTYFMVAVMVAHGWAAGLITREYSTVIRSLVQTLALLSSLLIGDPLRDNRLHFTGRAIPSWLLYLIVLLAALIFQTGRVNLK
ncbi:unnamed protein product, partial [Effrenium voratum]